MSSIEQRLQRLAQILGAQRPLCPSCTNRQVTIVTFDDPDGGPPEVVGERCRRCGSPDALQYHVVYDDPDPANPTNMWRKDG